MGTSYDMWSLVYSIAPYLPRVWSNHPNPGIQSRDSDFPIPKLVTIAVHMIRATIKTTIFAKTKAKNLNGFPPYTRYVPLSPASPVYSCFNSPRWGSWIE